MSYYPEPDSHIKDKVKVVLYMSNYAAKNKYNMPQGSIHLMQLIKNIAFKAKVDKQYMNKLTNVPTRLNNLKTKVDDFDVGKLKTVLVDMRKLRNVVESEVVKNT